MRRDQVARHGGREGCLVFLQLLCLSTNLCPTRGLEIKHVTLYETAGRASLWRVLFFGRLVIHEPRVRTIRRFRAA